MSESRINNNNNKLKDKKPPYAEEENVSQSQKTKGQPIKLSPEKVKRISQLKKQIQQNPKAIALYLELEKLLIEGGRKDLAILVLKKCLQIFPDNITVKSRLNILTQPKSTVLKTSQDNHIKAAIKSPEKPFRYRNILIGLGVCLLVLFIFQVSKWIFFPSTRVITTRDYSSSSPRWSPDGNKIAFIAQDDNYENKLCVYSVSDDSIKKISDIQGWEASDFSWSPDSGKLAYVSYVQDENYYGQSIFLIDSSGANTTRIVNGKKPSWSPDGNSIAIETLDRYNLSSDESPGISVVDVSSGNSIKVTDLPGKRPLFSPQGDKIVFSVPVESEINYNDNARGDEFSDFIDGALSGGAKTYRDAMNSLGREVELNEFDSKRKSLDSPAADLPKSNIYVVNRDGTNLRQLTDDNSSYSPLWSPEGEHIIYAHEPSDTTGLKIWSIDVISGMKKPLLESPEPYYPDKIVITSNGQYLIFPTIIKKDADTQSFYFNRTPRTDLIRIRIGKDKAERLSNKHPYKSDFDISPDGKTVVYKANDSQSDKTLLWMLTL